MAYENASRGVPPKESNIEFHCEEKYYNVVPEPVPAYEEFPEWYENTPGVLEDEYVEMPDTTSVKRCMPFLEGMAMGWVLKLPGNLLFENPSADEGIQIRWDMEFDMVDMSFQSDVMNVTYPDEVVMLKLTTPWMVSAREGWSLMVRPLPNRVNTPFKCTTGVLNADSFRGYLSGIVRWVDMDFTGVIEKGTPICQLIPIKRSEIANEYHVRRSTDEEKKAAEKGKIESGTNSSYYRDEVWEPIQRGEMKKDD